MRRRIRLVQEFNFLSEALPIALAGVLLNVAGRQIAGHYGISSLFVDMTGTAFAALLLGPWWGAAVAAATTTVNGNFFESYFPFGIVNITGALVWGYLSRVARLRNWLLHPGAARPRDLILWSIVLTLAGGLSAGLASTAVKLVLYPEIGRPFIYGTYYTQMQTALEAQFGRGVSPVATLAIVDLLRDLFDKAIVVPLALLLVFATRVAPMLGTQPDPPARTATIKTDLHSILFFSLLYSAYILLAQLTHPTISLAGAAHEVAWLSRPPIVVMLYTPLVAALFALIFTSFRPSDPYGRRLETLRQFRSYIFRNAFDPNDIRATFVRSQSTQALSMGVTLWSLRGVIDGRLGIPLGIIAIFVAIAAYVSFARLVYPRFGTAMQRTRDVHQWLSIDTPAQTGVRFLTLFRSIFSQYFSTLDHGWTMRGKIYYSLSFLIHRNRSKLEDLLFGQSDDIFSERIVLVAAIERPAAVTPEVCRDLHDLALGVRASLVAVISTTSRVADDEVLDWLLRIHGSGTEVLMFDWTDLTRGIAAEVLGNPPRVPVQLAKARLLQSIAIREQRMDVQGIDRVAWLVGRALPSLKFIIEHLPERSRVLDLGAGYGRHSFAALQAGHDVCAIERNEGVCDVFRSDLAASGLALDRVNLIHDDYMNVSTETVGTANLVVATGVLQHSSDDADLRRRLECMHRVADQPGSIIYIEMLFDMLFDGAPPKGRVALGPSEFEDLLLQIFPNGCWEVEVTSGPQRQRQEFDRGSRSFHAPAKRIESTTVEYAIRRLE